MTYLSTNIRLFRKFKSFTQDDLSTIIKVKRTTISGYEGGKSVPDLETLDLIVKVFGTTIDHIVNIDFSKVDILDYLEYIESNPFLNKQNVYSSIRTHKIKNHITQEKVTEKGNLIENEGNLMKQSPPNYVRLSDNHVHLNEEPHHYNSKPNNYLIPSSASAGYMDMIASGHQTIDLDSLNLPFTKKHKQYRTFEIGEDSMLPSFQNGDYVVCSKIEDYSYVIDNHAYIVVIDDGGLLLRRLMLDEKRKVIMLYPDNRDYKPKLLDFPEVLELWHVDYFISGKIPGNALLGIKTPPNEPQKP